MQQLKTNINLLPRSASKKQRIYGRNWAKLQQLADQCSPVKWPYKTTTSHSGCVFSRAVSTVNVLLLARRETQLPYIEKNPNEISSQDTTGSYRYFLLKSQIKVTERKHKKGRKKKNIYTDTKSYFLSMAVYLLTFLQYIFKTSSKKCEITTPFCCIGNWYREIKWIPEDHSGNLHWSNNLHFSFCCWAPEEEVGVPSGPGALQHCHRLWENKVKGCKQWTWHK